MNTVTQMATTLATAPEVVDTVDCTYCDVPIVPEVEDFDTAFQCSCGSWHHYDCGASSCTEYIYWLSVEAAE